MTTYYLDHTAVRALAKVPYSRLTNRYSVVRLRTLHGEVWEHKDSSISALLDAYDSDIKYVEFMVIVTDFDGFAQINITGADGIEIFLAPLPMPTEEVVPVSKPVYRINGKFVTKTAFIAYLNGKLAILESYVAALSASLTKHISNATFDAVLACLRKLYGAIDSLSSQLKAINY